MSRIRRICLVGLLSLLLTGSGFAGTAFAGLGDCGQPATAGEGPLASDALHILRASVQIVDCDECVCDVDGSGTILAGDALAILQLSVGGDVDLLCPSCGGPLRIGDLTSDGAEARQVSAAIGATVTLGDASLVVPPGALGQDAAIGLVRVLVSSLGLGADAGESGGQIPASDYVYMLFADRDVTLLAPLELRLPYDPGRLLGGHDNGDLQVSGVVGTYLVPQGPPTSVDEVSGQLVVSIDSGALLANFESMATRAPPFAAGGNFAALVTRLGGVSILGVVNAVLAGVSVGTQWQALVATVDDFKQLGRTFASLDWDDTFRIRYRSGLVTFSDAVDVGLRLAEAQDLFVDEMGMSLPNLIDLDGLYTVYIDDFANHSYVGGGAESPDGFTLPGTGLIEGASYVNASKNKPEWGSIAVHEYFHALQYGSLTSPFSSTNLEKVFNPTSTFLFEGSATALSGRLIFGSGTTPHRSDFLKREMPQVRSIYSLEDFDPQDTAQEFFVYLEKAFGDTSFYVPIFENLGSGALSGLDNQERAVAAIDQMLADTSGGSDNMFNAWRDFVEDRVVTAPNDYNVTPDVFKADMVKTLARDGATTMVTTPLPPLSYWIYRLQVPSLDPVDPSADDRHDLELIFTASGEMAGLTQLWLVGELPGQTLPMEVDIPSAIPRTVLRLSGVRDGTSRALFIVAANPIQFLDEDVTLQVDARVLRGELVPPTDRETEFEVCVDATVEQGIPPFVSTLAFPDLCIAADGTGGASASQLLASLDLEYSNIVQRGSMTGAVGTDILTTLSAMAERDLSVEPFGPFDRFTVDLHDVPLEDVFEGNESDPFDTLIYETTGVGVCGLIDKLEYDSAAGFFTLVDFDCSSTSSIYIRVDRPRPAGSR